MLFFPCLFSRSNEKTIDQPQTLLRHDQKELPRHGAPIVIEISYNPILAGLFVDASGQG